MNNEPKTIDEKQEDVKGEIKQTTREYVDTAKDYLNAASEKVSETVTDLKDKAKEKGEEIKEQANDVIDTIDEYAHKKPWMLIAGAAALGLVIGLSLQSKKKDDWC